MLDGQAVAHGRAVVHNIEGVLLQPDLLRELLDHFGQMIEGVFELVHSRHRAVTVAGVIRSDQVKLVGQHRDQIAEHVRTGREAVEQEHDWGILRPRLTVENIQAVDFCGPVSHSGRCYRSCGLFALRFHD